MKKILLLLTLLVTLVFSAELNWVDYDDDALPMAQKSGKTIMVMLSRKGCPGCEYMEDIVFHNENVVKKISKNFIAVHVDIHNDFIPDGLTYIGTPTFYFLNADEKTLEKMDGGVNAQSFMTVLDRVVKLSKK